MDLSTAGVWPFYGYLYKQSEGQFIVQVMRQHTENNLERSMDEAQRCTTSIVTSRMVINGQVAPFLSHFAASKWSILQQQTCTPITTHETYR